MPPLKISAKRLVIDLPELVKRPSVYRDLGEY